MRIDVMLNLRVTMILIAAIVLGAIQPLVEASPVPFNPQPDPPKPLPPSDLS